MDEFERELRRAMRTVDVPQGFAGRVMARACDEAAGLKDGGEVPAGRPGRLLRWPQRAPVRGWVGGALAAALVLGTLAGVEVDHRRRQREQAERNFAVAMRVTDRALEQTRSQLSRAGFRLVD